MNIRIQESPGAADTEVVITCRQADEQILKMISLLHTFEKKLTGVKDGETFLLDAASVLYIDTVDKKTFLYTKNGVYETPLRLYELEERLSASDFLRAGKSCIVNFAQVQSLRPEFGGKLILTLTSKERIFVSRQYAAAVKQKLGI